MAPPSQYPAIYDQPHFNHLTCLLAQMNLNKLLPNQFFYGWWIVAAAIVCQFVSMSVGQGVVGIFLQPVATDLGWAVWQYTLGPSLALGIGAVAGIGWGQVVDQRGPRLLIQVGAIVCGLCFLGLAWQSHLWLYWLLHILAGVMGWNLFGPLIISATLSKWFVQQRGWALAIGSIGVSLASIITPVVMTRIVDSAGWRTGYAVLGVFILTVIIPISFIMRRMPEDMGLRPDGVAAEKPELQAAASRTSNPSLTRAEAMRTPGFWLLSIGFGIW